MAISKIDILQEYIQGTTNAAIAAIGTAVAARQAAVDAKITELGAKVIALQLHIDETVNLNSTALQTGMEVRLGSMQTRIDDSLSSGIADLRNDISVLRANLTSMASSISDLQLTVVEKIDYFTNILKIFTGVTDCENDNDCEGTYSYNCVGGVCTQSDLL